MRSMKAVLRVLFLSFALVGPLIIAASIPSVAFAMPVPPPGGGIGSGGGSSGGGSSGGGGSGGSSGGGSGSGCPSGYHNGPVGVCYPNSSGGSGSGNSGGSGSGNGSGSGGGSGGGSGSGGGGGGGGGTTPTCPAGTEPQSVNVPNSGGQTTQECLVTATSNPNPYPASTTSDVTIISSNPGVYQQDFLIDPHATFMYVPQSTIAQGPSAIQAYIEQSYGAITTSLVITLGGTGTGGVNPTLNQAIASMTTGSGSTVLQLAGNSSLQGFDMLAQAVNTYQNGSLNAVINSLTTLASMSGGTTQTTNPWAGNGPTLSGSNGTVGASVVQAFTQVLNNGGSGGSGGGTPVTSSWYAIPIPVWPAW